MSLISSFSDTMNQIGTQMIWGMEAITTRQLLSPEQISDAALGHKILRTVSVAMIVAIAAQLLLAVPPISTALAIMYSVVWFAGELSLRNQLPGNAQEVVSEVRQGIAGLWSFGSQALARLRTQGEVAEGVRQAREQEVLNNDFATLLGRTIKELLFPRPQQNPQRAT
jgi:hypothetical protein